MHRRLVSGVMWVQAVAAVEAELGELLFGRAKEDRIFETYGNKTVASDQQRKEWFLDTRLSHDVLFQMNPKSSVTDLALRNKLMMEKKHEDMYKDTLTFLFLSVFVPRFTFVMSSLNLLKNLSITLGPWGNQITTTQEYMELGRYSRLILIGLPLRYLF